ncbi:hypothetical protein AAII07_35675 [Microvirga sp. 0TCS3.31]
MTEHLVLPEVALQKGALQPMYVPYLREWRETAIQRADQGDTAASVCHQGALVDLVLHGEVRHPWHEIMDEFLTADGKPLAYSKEFGTRLYKFDAQYRQTTIHAIHTRWWLEQIVKPTTVDHAKFAAMIMSKRQSDGLIYDADVSPTTLRHRMKSELMLSSAMSCEILCRAGLLVGSLPLELATNIVDPRKCPPLGYMSAEYFRLYALRLLGYLNLFPTGIADHIDLCATDLEVGWGDFAMQSKVDAYMGTAKRTRRDKPIHSPLIACYVAYLADTLADAEAQVALRVKVSSYARHLTNFPNDIPAFQMRDVPISFGAGITPIEMICASHLIAQYERTGALT